MSANDAPIFPDEVVDIILDHLLNEGAVRSELTRSSEAVADWRAITGCARGPYYERNWTFRFRHFASYLRTCKSWRRRCLEVLMQRVEIIDLQAKDGYDPSEDEDYEDYDKAEDYDEPEDYDTSEDHDTSEHRPTVPHVCELNRFDTLCSATSGLLDGLAASSHIRHLTYGREDKGITGYLMIRSEGRYEKILRANKDADALGQPWTLAKEVTQAVKVLKHMPPTLASLRWCSPLPIRDEVAQVLAALPIQDVYINSTEYYRGECAL